MKNEIVVDVEIAKCIGQEGLGWDDTDKLGISCAVVYSYKLDRFRVYGPSAEDLKRLRNVCLEADLITTFNGYRFDFPVIFGVPRRAAHPIPPERSNDLLRRIWIACGHDPDSPGPKGYGGNKLDDICRNTIGRLKIGSGAEAPVWYQEGDWARLVSYCIDDVALERDLDNFVRKYGYVINGLGERIELSSPVK